MLYIIVYLYWGLSLTPELFYHFIIFILSLRLSLKIYNVSSSLVEKQKPLTAEDERYSAKLISWESCKDFNPRTY